MNNREVFEELVRMGNKKWFKGFNAEMSILRKDTILDFNNNDFAFYLKISSLSIKNTNK
jgi:hypothetical protein